MKEWNITINEINHEELRKEILKYPDIPQEIKDNLTEFANQMEFKDKIEQELKDTKNKQ
jgi:hypothetical protein